METIYLIQPAELIGTDIYKFGFSLSEEIGRCKNGYKKGTKYLCIIKCKDAKKLEDKVKINFAKKFQLVTGKEFYRGNEQEIQHEFLKIVFKHIGLEPEEKDNIEQDIYKNFLDECTIETKTNISNAID